MVRFDFSRIKTNKRQKMIVAFTILLVVMLVSAVFCAFISNAAAAEEYGFNNCKNQVPEELISKSRIIWPVTVVPTLAPIMIPRD